MSIICGDSLEVLKTLPNNSVDSVVTDPPYGLAFMNKHWDYDVPSVDVWREVIRVLKPGGHLLSFGGTRTYHRMVVAIEDAGFEIRDQIQWIYGSGFPKSMDISKAIDKAAGAEREVIKEFAAGSGPLKRGHVLSTGGGMSIGTERSPSYTITAPSTDLAKQWSGWGTALKPANEPIVLARKPISEKTVAKNVERWGVGGLNIDGCRVEASKDYGRSVANSNGTINAHEGFEGKSFKIRESNAEYASQLGRWPANVIFDEAAGAMLDEQSGYLHPSGNKKKGLSKNSDSMFGIGLGSHGQSTDYKDTGGASRFFYCAKASKGERNAGQKEQFNIHATVKPLKLMQYLVRLVTPPNGTVLDPYCGSGTTGVACVKEGFNFVGIEREAEYIAIAERRIKHAKKT